MEKIVSGVVYDVRLISVSFICRLSSWTHIFNGKLPRANPSCTCLLAAKSDERNLKKKKNLLQVQLDGRKVIIGVAFVSQTA